MKSGLYACAGASATARAAAWANRFDEPMTNESKVYFALKPPLSGRCGGTSRSTGATRAAPGPRRPAALRRRLGPARHLELDPAGDAGDVPDGRADQLEEVALDPVAREIVRDGEDESALVEGDARRVGEPGVVRRVVEGAPEPTGNVTPQALRSQLDLVLHPAANSSLVNRNATLAGRQMGAKRSRFAGAFEPPRDPSTAVDKYGGNSPAPHRCAACTCGQVGGRSSSILAPRAGRRTSVSPSFDLFSREADLPAQRTAPKAQARVSRPDVDARRTPDPEEAPAQGPRAALGVEPRRRP